MPVTHIYTWGRSCALIANSQMLLTSYAQQLALFSCLFVLRTMITRSALVVLHDFTSAERVLNEC